MTEEHFKKIAKLKYRMDRLEDPVAYFKGENIHPKVMVKFDFSPGRFDGDDSLNQKIVEAIKPVVTDHYKKLKQEFEEA